MTPLQRLLDLLQGWKKVGDRRFIARCPAHDDTNPSLSISEADDGRVLICCHAGCDSSDVVGAVGLSLKDLFPEKTVDSSLIAAYDYRDENGQLLFQVLRYQPKEFRQRRPNGTGGWEWKLNGVRRVPYRLPELLFAARAGGSIWVAEGEKDVEALVAKGLTATTNAGGVGKWRAEYGAAFAGAKRACVIPDADDVGRQHAQDVANALAAVVPDVRVVHLPMGVKDAAEFFERGDSAEQLDALAEAAPAHEGRRPAEPMKGTTPVAAGNKQPPKRTLQTERASDVEPRSIRWAWIGRIPFGKVTILEGEPGLGKTLVGVDLLARLTTGAPMPLQGDAGGQNRGGNVLFATYEDDHGDTVRPRFEAAGADLERVHLVKLVGDENSGAPMTLPDDLDLLREKIRELAVLAVVIDPWSAAVSGQVDTHRDQDVRRVLSLLRQLAEDSGAAIIIVRHLRKNPSQGAINAGQGSIGIIGAARAGHLIARDPDDPEGEDGAERVFATVKLNLGKKLKALRFRVVETECGGVWTAKIEWTGESPATADSLIERAPGGGDGGAATDAAMFLRTELAEGPRPVREVQAAAKAAGVAWRTVERAKSAAGVESVKTRFDGQWVLQFIGTKPANTASEEDMAAFAKTANTRVDLTPRNQPEDRHGERRPPNPSAPARGSHL